MKSVKQHEYEFTLQLDGVDELTFDRVDRLFEAGCGDATFGTRAGVHFGTFHRKAASPLEAVLSAIEDIERAGLGLRTVRVEPDELVTTSEIARRAKLSREAIRLYAQGKRGPGGFPAPVAGQHQKSPLYKWTKVAAWLDRVRRDSSSLDSTEADSIAFVNAALELRRLAVSVPDAEAALRRLKNRTKRLAQPGGTR